MTPTPGRWLKGLLFLVLAVATGCREPRGPLILGTHSWLGYEPLHLALARGYLDSSRVRLAEYSSATQAIRAFRNGTVDAATLTLDEVLLLARTGQSPRVVLALDVSHGADVIVGRPGIHTLASLRGKRVGVELTALGAYLVTRGLATVGLTPSDVTLVDLEVDEHETAFHEGRVDALVCFQPTAAHLIAAGGRVLFDSSHLPGEIVDVLAVRESYLRAHPEEVAGLVRAWFQTLAYMRADSASAAAFIGRRIHLSPAEVLAGYRQLPLVDLAQNVRLLAGRGAALLSSADSLAAIMMRHQLLDGPVAVESLLAPEPLLTTARERGSGP